MTETNKDGQEAPNNSEATPAKESAATPEVSKEATPPKEEAWEYTGDRKAVPDEFRKYAKGFDRYVSKKDEMLSEYKQKVGQYEQQLKELQSTPQSTEPTGSEPVAPPISKDEADAIALGDVNVLYQVVDRLTQKKIEDTLTPKELAMTEKLQALTQKQTQIDNTEMVKSFADVHPGFREALEDDFIYDYMFKAVQNGQSLDKVWTNVQNFEETVQNKMVQKKQKDLEEKKDGTVVGRTPTGSSEIVYVDNPRDAQKLAIDFALKGDPRQVAVKRK